MILTDKIKIKVNGFMVKKYNELGFNVKQNDIIELPVQYLSKYSHLKVLCKCDVCGLEKEIKYNNYHKYIEKDINNLYTCNICNLEKRKNTCIEKYGVDNISKSESIKKKVKQSMQENGTDYGFRTKSYIDTLVQKYGVNNPSQSQEIKDLKEKTYLKNYSVKNPSQSQEIKDLK